MNVSIVVITRDRPYELQCCLRHISNQTLPAREAIIVDGSTEGVGRYVVDRLRTETKNTELVYNRCEAGTGRQRRRGVEVCGNEIVLFIDDDVYIKKNFIEEICRVFNSNWKNIGGVTGREVSGRRLPFWSYRYLMRQFFMLPNPGKGRFKASGMHTTANGLDGVRQVDYMGGAFTAYRKEVLDEIPPCAEYSFFFEDADLSYRVSRRYQNFYCSQACCRHVASQTNRMSVDEWNRVLLNSYRFYWEKNFEAEAKSNLPFRLACFGISHGFYHMCGTDAVFLLARKCLGELGMKHFRRIKQKMCRKG